MKIGVIIGCLLGILALGAVSTDYSSTALAEESIKAACPTCVDKDVLRKGMGMMPHEKTMSCPDCKDKGTEHACEKCSLERLNCSKCKKVSAAVEREPAMAACPSRGEKATPCKGMGMMSHEKATLCKGMGMMSLEKATVCPDCKGKDVAHVRKSCSDETLACPGCKGA
ncbi:MAG: hypothetical protein ACUZ8A_07845 [Candidatus Bathyanammoxibius sp.]